jgi:Arc/MetJ-type ribon-helix-helix transcriptional regulator
MTIHLPNDLESSIQAVVHTGRFASVDDAMAAAARLLLREIKQEQSEPKPNATDASPDPLLGVWHDAADELDEIVADAMKQRREEPWRAIAGE